MEWGEREKRIEGIELFSCCHRISVFNAKRSRQEVGSCWFYSGRVSGHPKMLPLSEETIFTFRCFLCFQHDDCMFKQIVLRNLNTSKWTRDNYFINSNCVQQKYCHQVIHSSNQINLALFFDVKCEWSIC